jgi:hypothetical protein
MAWRVAAAAWSARACLANSFPPEGMAATRLRSYAAMMVYHQVL